MTRALSALALLAVTAFALATALGCTKKYWPPPTAVIPPTATVFVTPDSVQAIFSAKCLGCHGNSFPAANMNLTPDSSYANIVQVAATACPTLKRIEPFQPDNSCLALRITGAVIPRMPLGQPSLPAASINTIRNWILHGAPGTSVPAFVARR